MITEGLQNIAEGFKNKFSRETVSATVGNPHNATKQMAQKKQPPVKALNVKKPIPHKVGSVDTAFYTKKPVSKGSKLRTGDSLADVGAKLFSFVQTTEDERKTHYELNRNFEREHQVEDEKNHTELINTIKNQKEKQKKEEAERKAKEEKAEKERKEKEKKDREEREEKERQAEQEKEKHEKEQKHKESQTKKTAEPEKPGAEPAKPSATPSTTGTTSSPAKTSSPATTSSSRLPSFKSLSTARKIASFSVPGLANGVSAAQAFSMRGEVGATAENVTNPEIVGKVVYNDPEVGSNSYGVFGINSKKPKSKDGKEGKSSIDVFIEDNPQFGFRSKPGSKAFDDEWHESARKDPKKLLEAQLKYYKKYVEDPVQNDLRKAGIPKDIAENDGVKIYMADRANQYGSVSLQSALSFAKDAKTPVEFIKLMTEYDSKEENLRRSFATDLSTHPDHYIGLLKRQVERGEFATLQAENTSSNLNQSSVNNQDNKNKLKQSTTTVINNTQTNIIGGGKPTVQTIKERIPDLPPIFMGN